MAPDRVTIPRWTADLWAKASGSTSRFDATVIVRSMSVTGEWNAGNRRMASDIEYRGTLDRLDGDPLGQIPADVRFEVGQYPSGSQHTDSETLGLAYTGAFGDERSGIALLSVRIWGDEVGAQAFEAAFLRALAAGQDGLHVWLFADRKAPPVSGADALGFGVIQPLTRIQFRQLVRLGVPRSP